MFNFFVENNSRKGNCYYIEGHDFNHIRNVLRMHEGDTILVSESGMSHLCSIVSLEGDTCVAEITEDEYNSFAEVIRYCQKSTRGWGGLEGFAGNGSLDEQPSVLYSHRRSERGDLRRIGT